MIALERTPLRYYSMNVMLPITLLNLLTGNGGNSARTATSS